MAALSDLFPATIVLRSRSGLNKSRLAIPPPTELIPSASLSVIVTIDELLLWVRDYEQRDDEFSLTRHREIFTGFGGPKTEYTLLPAL